MRLNPACTNRLLTFAPLVDLAPDIQAHRTHIDPAYTAVGGRKRRSSASRGGNFGGGRAYSRHGRSMDSRPPPWHRRREP